MGDPLVVGVDVGTTATKAAVFDPAGVPLATAAAGYPISRPRAGWAEQDPDDWWRATTTVLRALASRVDLSRVRAVGVVSQVNTHAFVDADLRAVAPAVLWQDQRCADVARALDRRFTPDERHVTFGGPFTIDSSYLVARAGWLAQHDPELWRRTRWVLLPKDYVIARLTGGVGTDPVSAIGLVDQAGVGYLPGVLALLDGVEHRLPPLARPAAAIGTVTDPDCGLPLGATVVAGTMDAWGNLYGSGATAAGNAILVAGTSEIAAVVSDRHVPTPGVIAFPPMDGLFVHAGPTQAGGDALRWWADTRSTTIDDVLAAAAGAPAGAGGVVFLPHLLGERAPLWDADVHAAFLGVSSDTTAAALARAVLEGVAMSARELFEAVAAAAGRPVTVLALSGGGARSDLWCQIKADVLDRPLHRLAVCDSAVLGAALLAGVGVGVYPTLAAAAEQAVHVDRVFEPDPDAAARYADLYAVYRDAYQALAGVHADLAKWRAGG